MLQRRENEGVSHSSTLASLYFFPPCPPQRGCYSKASCACWGWNPMPLPSPAPVGATAALEHWPDVVCMKNNMIINK